MDTRTYIYRTQFAESRTQPRRGESCTQLNLEGSVGFFLFFPLSLKTVSPFPGLESLRIEHFKRCTGYCDLFIASRSRRIIDITERIRGERREREVENRGWQRRWIVPFDRLSCTAASFFLSFFIYLFIYLFISFFFLFQRIYVIVDGGGRRVIQRTREQHASRLVFAPFCVRVIREETWSGPSVMNKLDDTVLVRRTNSY